jgi:MoaA/NifB/PqqE/SkfB family radical SAM enzyme
MPFCYSPWTNIDISPQGNLSPCCKFIHQIPPLNIKSSTIRDYQQSAELLETQQSFQKGEWPIGCERCKIEEESDIESKRILDYQRWKTDYSQYQLSSKKFLTASIAFGNTCNLTCITCNPYSSSRWHQEYRDIYEIDILPNHFYKEGFVEEIIGLTTDLIHIDIPGGEPFLSGVTEQHKLLHHWIESGQSCNMSIHYTTNATVYPDSEWWLLWKHFKNVDIQLSIDGIGNKLEYIRYPAKWHNVETNIKKFISKIANTDNLQISVSHTVSAYNIYYIDEFFTWCKEIGLPTPWLGKVHKPQHMRPTVWPKEAREFIINHLYGSQHKEVNPWISLLQKFDDSFLFNEFKKRTDQHDQYRNLNFSTTFKEMSKWFY